MKNILFLLLLIPVISFSQFSKKELKKFKKMDLKIVNRGLDLNATFVAYSEQSTQGYIDLVEDSWETAMFSQGLEVGDYSEQRQVKDANNREMNLSGSLIFNGRYVFDTSTHKQIKIQDLNNNNKIVATITYKGSLGWGMGNNPLIRKKEYVIYKLIESNK